MRMLCRAACVALASGFFLTAPVQSTSLTTDQSDLWWIPSESGWGMQLVNRGSVIFATLFVYGPTGNPTWYTATLDSTANNLTWTGDLYATTGPYFETVPFNPMSVVLTKVGTMTWAAQTIDTGTLSYVVERGCGDEECCSPDPRRRQLQRHLSGRISHHCDRLHKSLEQRFRGHPFSNVHRYAERCVVGIALVALTTITISGTLSQSGQFGTVPAPIRRVPGSWATPRCRP